jgi:hypothetical protein
MKIKVHPGLIIVNRESIMASLDFEKSLAVKHGA